MTWRGVGSGRGGPSFGDKSCSGWPKAGACIGVLADTVLSQLGFTCKRKESRYYQAHGSSAKHHHLLLSER